MSRSRLWAGLGLLGLTAAGCIPFGWLHTGPNEPLPAPFVLRAGEQAALDRVLTAWDRQYADLKTLSCRFVRWQYDPVWGDGAKPRSVDEGSLQYAAPDRAAFRVEGANPEHWTCDATAVFELDHRRNRLFEHRLPPQLRGRPVGDGPLPTPLVFAASSKQLRQRYFLRISTPPGETGRVWLAVRPRFKHDAAYFTRAEMILDGPDVRLVAIQVHAPKGSRTVYRFEDIAADKPMDEALFRSALPAGWEKVVEP